MEIKYKCRECGSVNTYKGGLCMDAIVCADCQFAINMIYLTEEDKIKIL